MMYDRTQWPGNGRARGYSYGRASRNQGSGGHAPFLSVSHAAARPHAPFLLGGTVSIGTVSIGWHRIFQFFDQNKVVSIKIQGRQTSLRPQLTWYCSQIVVGRGGDCCCRPPLHNPPTDRSATRANRDARTQRTSILFVPFLPPPSGECRAEEYFEF